MRKQFTFRFFESELEKWRSCASNAGNSLTGWLRWLANTAADDEPIQDKLDRIEDKIDYIIKEE